MYQIIVYELWTIKHRNMNQTNSKFRLTIVIWVIWAIVMFFIFAKCARAQGIDMRITPTMTTGGTILTKTEIPSLNVGIGPRLTFQKGPYGSPRRWDIAGIITYQSFLATEKSPRLQGASFDIGSLYYSGPLQNGSEHPVGIGGGLMAGVLWPKQKTSQANAIVGTNTVTTPYLGAYGSLDFRLTNASNCKRGNTQVFLGVDFGYQYLTGTDNTSSLATKSPKSEVNEAQPEGFFLGLNLRIDPEQVGLIIRDIGIGKRTKKRRN